MTQTETKPFFLSGDEEFLPFSYPTISDNEIQEVIACLKSGWITTGPRVKAFEELLAKYLEAPHALSLTSATAGLHLALQAIGIKEGDEVITTPMTFVSTTNVIELLGGVPVFVDADPKTYCIDVSKIERAITSRTKAILPVHFAGAPVDMDYCYEIARNYKLRVIEDAAHAIGTKYRSQKIGSFGDIQVFSFHPNKNMTTVEGGGITTRDAEIAKKISLLRFHGIDREVWNRFTKKGSPHYDVVLPGYKFNLTDLQASLGIHQIKKLDAFNEKRAVLANKYLQALEGWDELILPPKSDYYNTHAWHLFAPLVSKKSKLTRDELILALKEYNIGAGVHYRPVHLFSYYREKYGYKEGDFPCAEFIGDNILSLPLFPLMTEDNLGRVIEALSKIFKHK